MILFGQRLLRCLSSRLPSIRARQFEHTTISDQNGLRLASLFMVPENSCFWTRRGKREIDIYRNGLMFEKDNVVGVSKR